MIQTRFLLIFSLLLPALGHSTTIERLRPAQLEIEKHLEKKPALLSGPLEDHLVKLFPTYVPSGEEADKDPLARTTKRFFNLSEKQKTIWTAATGLAIPLGVLAQGMMSWNWDSDKKKFGFGSEGWFEPDSYSGGADKTGHMMSHYIQKRFYTWLFYQLGSDHDHAQLYGVLGAGLTGLMIEVGDGISRFRFSWEDILMDTIGITLGWLLDEYPKLDELIGLRWEYWPSTNWFSAKNPDKVDFMSDYSGQKFFFTLKAKGIPLLRERWYTRYLTLDFGFYTRGYKPDFTPEFIKQNNNSQWFSYGIGINLSSLIKDIGPKNGFFDFLGSLTKYWIPPGVVVTGSSPITQGKFSTR